MSWEKRKSKFYYYRVRRDRNGRLKKTFYGTGSAAQRAYEEDLQGRKKQEQSRQEKAHLAALDDQNKELTNVTKTLTKASLLGAGFHQHKRQWRRRRDIKHIYQQGENDMQNTLAIETRSYDALEDLVSQAQEGNTSALPAIRELLDQVPEIWQDSRVLANRVERSWMMTLCGRELVSQEVIEREVQALRRQLQGQNPSPLETLLVDRICTCWLAVQHAELQAGKRLNAHRFALSSAEENRLDKVHRRFLMAIRELARVRKLLTPEQKFQVNVSHNQIVA